MKKMMVGAAVSCLSLGIGFTNLRAHDEGHGPMLTDVAAQGGMVSPVIDMKDSMKGAKAVVVYKAELVREGDGMVSVTLYDKEMNPLETTKFGKTAKGFLETEKKGKVSKVPFSLTFTDGMFTGKTPKPSTKPFNIEVAFKEGDKELLVTFENLD